MSVETPSDQNDITVATDDAVVNASAATGAEESVSSESGSKDDGPASMLEAVMGAVKADDADASTSKATPAEGPLTSSETQVAQSSAPDADKLKSVAEAAAKEVTDPTVIPEEEVKNYGPRARERIGKLVAKTNELQRNLEEAKPYREEAEVYGLQAEDRKLLFAIGKTLQQGDFSTFLAAVEPYYRMAMEATGKQLPKDLQDQVDDGYTTQEIASELARSRYQSKVARSQAQAAHQQIATHHSVQQTAALQQVVSDWEASVRTRDPDYAHKAEDVRAEAYKLVQMYGQPKSAQDVVAYVTRAYEEVNKIASKYGSQRTATRPTPANSFRSGGNARAAPSNMMEAIMQGLSAK